MAIQYVSGDLFTNSYGARALAHGVNCKGSMGPGIAVGFRERSSSERLGGSAARYPEMYEEYRRRCTATPRELNPGDCFLWEAGEQPWVFNLATQEDYWRSRATYEAVERALVGMREQAEAEGILTIAMPRIGTGYGGLSWKKLRAMVERVFDGWQGTLYVYEDYVPAQSVDATMEV
ncbi:MAG TPA: macro domain-containing protein [Ktedonobacterales bacterium]|nr:macro domain-containing protein [Ktedonobacterales bacterium]